MKPLFAALALLPFCAAFATGTAAPSASAVAGLQEDVSALRDEVRRLQSELETMREALDKERAANRVAKPAAPGDTGAMNAKLAALETAQSAARKADKAELTARLDELDRKLDSLKTGVNKALAEQTRQVNAALTTGAAATTAPVKPAEPAAPKAPPAPPAEAPADMPKTGVRYTVKPGDSVPKIAKKMNSKAAWILAANKYKSNADLKAHDTIFIPQAEETAAAPKAE